MYRVLIKNVFCRIFDHLKHTFGSYFEKAVYLGWVQK